MFTPAELQNLSAKDLHEEQRKAKKELYKLHLSRSSAQLKEVHKLKLQRQYLARIATYKTMMAKEAPTKAATIKG